MKLSEVKTYLANRDELIFRLPDGTAVAAHFHVTEIGIVHKHFIDCGGTVRQETVANFQLWHADDYDHRLEGQKLLRIIELSQEKLGLGDLEVEVEYQGPDTIGKYGLAVGEAGLELTSKVTDCLAREECNVPAGTPTATQRELPTLAVSNGCQPGGGCC